MHTRTCREGWERAGRAWLADNWSIGIRRIGKLALGSVLCPRYAARIESRVWLALTGDQRRRAMSVLPGYEISMAPWGFSPERSDN
jgi:hypothetical protein